MTMMTTNNAKTDDGPRTRGTPTGAIPTGIDPASIWAALICDTQCCVVLAEVDGTVNLGDADAIGCGCTVEDCPLKASGNVTCELPGEQAAQLLSCMKRASENGSPIVLIWFLAGIRSRTVIRPIETESGPMVLLTTRLAKGAYFAEEPESEDVIHSLIGDAGPLASLTPRETQVLEMIGRGYSTAKIAKTLDRSTKTVEWHRASIGNKLNASNRVELARIAIAAGLTAL